VTASPGRALVAFLLALSIAACGRTSAPASSGAPGVIRVGYFPNITHSQALLGLARGDFAKALGPETQIETTTFNAGPSVIEALFANQIDLAYIGPNPAINGYVQSGGEALRIVAGATSGGAAFVVRPDAGIETPDDLHGKTLASLQLGNTQDVALGGYLESNGLKTVEQGGDVEVVNAANPQILDLFRLGQIDGAWVPELWPNYLFPSPGEVGASLVSGLRDGTFSIGIRASVVRLIQGYAISLVLGLTLGLLMAQTRWLKDTLAWP